MQVKPMLSRVNCNFTSCCLASFFEFVYNSLKFSRYPVISLLDRHSFDSSFLILVCLLVYLIALANTTYKTVVKIASFFVSDLTRDAICISILIKMLAF